MYGLHQSKVVEKRKINVHMSLLYTIFPIPLCSKGFVFYLVDINAHFLVDKYSEFVFILKKNQKIFFHCLNKIGLTSGESVKYSKLLQGLLCDKKRW